jgi:hypothetical protein
VSFLEEILDEWQDSSDSLFSRDLFDGVSDQFRAMKEELRRDRDNIINESRNFVAEQRDQLNREFGFWQNQWGEPAIHPHPQSIQNLYPEKREKVNWQKEGF